MRLRVRVSDSESPTGGGWLSRCWAWLQGGGAETPAPAAAPALVLDKRWTPIAGCHYLQRGRKCVKDGDAWRSEYWFDVAKDGRIRLVCVDLPEEVACGCDNRVSEAERLRAVMAVLERLVASGESRGGVRELPEKK